MTPDRPEITAEEETAHWLPVSPPGVPATADGPRLDLWGLVLRARGVPHAWAVTTDGETVLTAPPECLAEAEEEIRLFEEENRDWPPAGPPPRSSFGNPLAVLSILVLLAAFHNVTTLDGTLFGHVLPDWVSAGSADSGKILAGEWWRLVTSLTLHADYAHLAGNIGIGGLFILALCRETGAGTGFALLLASGALGNLANALFQPPTHSSVGASTLVFGAVGMLAYLAFADHRASPRRRAAIIGAAAALLALLGTEGVRTDLGAHLFGCVAGVLVGIPARHLVIGPRRSVPDMLFGAGAAVAVAVSWLWALA